MTIIQDTYSRARRNSRKVIVGTLIAVGGVVASAPWTPTNGTTANLWSKASGTGTCARSSTPLAYDPTTACVGLAAAWQASSSGDTVRVKAGSYAAQTFFNHTPTMTSPGVTFRYESGVTVASMQFGRCSCEGTRQDADYISMVADDATSGRVTAHGLEFAHTSNISFDGFNVDGQNANKKLVYMGGDAKTTTFDRSDIGNTNHQQTIYSSLDDGEGSSQANSGWTFRRTNIHDAHYDPGDHTECLFAEAMSGLTIDRVHMYSCGAMNINIGDFHNPVSNPNDNWTIKNSIMECPIDEGDSKACQSWFQGCNDAAKSTKPGWVVEYNLLEGTWYSGGGTGCGDTGAVIRGNLGRIGSNCPSSQGATMSKNLWSDNACTGDNTQVSTLWTNSANWLTAYSSSAVNQTFVPKSGAVQIDKGTTSSYPTVDYLDLGRYVGAAPDAGPYEFGAS